MGIDRSLVKEKERNKKRDAKKDKSKGKLLLEESVEDIMVNKDAMMLVTVLFGFIVILQASLTIIPIVMTYLAIAHSMPVFFIGLVILFLTIPMMTIFIIAGIHSLFPRKDPIRVYANGVDVPSRLIGGYRFFPWCDFNRVWAHFYFPKRNSTYRLDRKLPYLPLAVPIPMDMDKVEPHIKKIRAGVERDRDLPPTVTWSVIFEDHKNFIKRRGKV